MGVEDGEAIHKLLKQEQGSEKDETFERREEEKFEAKLGSMRFNESDKVHSTLDYSKWQKMVDSDDEKDDRAKKKASAAKDQHMPMPKTETLQESQQRREKQLEKDLKERDNFNSVMSLLKGSERRAKEDAAWAAKQK